MSEKHDILKVPDSTKEKMLNPASELIGQAFRGIAHFIFDPLVKYNMVKDLEIEEFERNTRNKMNNIPIENRDASKLGLAYKAVEDSIYQLNSEELREMFANLIASTVDNRKNQLVHPSFSSILKDLSPDDAKLFEFIFKNNAIPLASIRVYNRDNHIGFIIKKNIILWYDTEIQMQSSLNNLLRFGLIEYIPDYLLQKHKNLYDEFKKSQIYKEVESKLPIQSDEGTTIDSIELEQNCVMITDLGKNFGQVVIS